MPRVCRFLKTLSHARTWRVIDRWGGLKAYPARATTPAAADGVEDLLAIVVEGAQEHPPRKAVEAVALPILVIVLAS